LAVRADGKAHQRSGFCIDGAMKDEAGRQQQSRCGQAVAKQAPVIVPPPLHHNPHELSWARVFTTIAR